MHFHENHKFIKHSFHLIYFLPYSSYLHDNDLIFVGHTKDFKNGT